MKTFTQLMKGLRPQVRSAAAVALVAGLAGSPLAQADQILFATTDMVSGKSAATFSFDAPSAGTVTAHITSLPWPDPLSALSFSATNATDTLASWTMGSASNLAPMALNSNDDASSNGVATFQVGAGTYFAHVMAAAGGSLDLGLYSMMLTFTPSAVPLPAAAGLLLLGLAVFFGLRSTLLSEGQHRNESVTSVA